MKVLKNVMKRVGIVLLILGMAMCQTEISSFAYTVEFTHGGYQYVLPGDSSIALSEIMDTVGLTGEVSDVEVSDESLFSAMKCEMSADEKAPERDENGDLIESETGEWIVTAHRAFSTTEWMKVTINDVVYEIAVTDTSTSTLNVGGTDYTLFTGFTATSGNGTNYAKLVDGNTTSDWSATKNYDDPNAPANDFAGGTDDPAFVEFHADEPIVPKGYVLTCDHENAGFWKPVEWALKAKLNESDGWTTIQSLTTTLGQGKTFEIACDNDGDNEYQYFRFEVYEVGTTMTVDLDELQFYGLLPTYTHLTVKAATCMATGIKQDCYRRNSDGKYFTDNTGTTELAESDVIAPIIPHTGEHHEATDVNIEYWQCSMCGKYFSDSGYTTEITEEQTKIYRTITIDGSISSLVTVAFSKTQALAGESIILYVSDLIDASTLKVNNGAVELTAVTDIQYTFTMPAADVTVTADVAQSNADGDVLTGSIRHTVTIPDGASITLNNATITGSIVCEGSATITLVGTNSVSGATNKAGIQIGGSGTTLTINGDGTLTANGGDNSAGIGLSRAWNVTEDVVGGNIVINGGNITANGGGGGAGIGAGVTKDPNNSSSRKAIVGTITIAGGSVTAVGGSNADGIGAGENNYNATIQIGTVTIYDSINMVDATSIKDFANLVYMHGETNVTASKNEYFTISGNGDHKIITPLHTHSFTYSAAGATITAACSKTNCPLTDHKVILTITAPTGNLTYNGSARAATLTGLGTFNTATGLNIAESGIVYYAATKNGDTYIKSGNALTGAPKDAGNYVAEITVQSKTANIGYTIAKRTPSITVPTGLTATYGQTLADVSLTSHSGWAWADATTSVGNVGTNTFKATFTPSNTTNFEIVNNVDVTVTVGKAANPATLTGSVSVTKGSHTVNLSNYISGAQGAVSYAITSALEGCSVNGVTGEFTSGNTTGECTVTATIAGNDNYDSTSVVIPVTVTDKATQTISFVTATLEKTWGDASFTNELSGVQTSVQYAVTAGSEYASVDTATGTVTILAAGGTATITATAASDETYAGATASYRLTVKKARITITAKNQNTYVNDTVPSLASPALGTHYTVTGLKSGESLGGTITMKYQKDGADVTPSSSIAGTYDIVVSGATVPTGGNYEDEITYTKGILTINTRPGGGGGSGGSGSGGSGSGGSNPSASPAPSASPGASPAPSIPPTPTAEPPVTTTVTNPDGSTTTMTTETDAEGTRKTESETVKPDGTVEKTNEIVKADGSTEKITEVINPDGSSEKTTDIENADGSTEKTTETITAKGTSEKISDIVKADGTTIHAEIQTTAKGKETSRTVETTPSGNTTVTEQVKQPSGDYTKVAVETVLKKDDDGRITGATVTINTERKTGKVTVSASFVVINIGRSAKTSLKSLMKMAVSGKKAVALTKATTTKKNGTITIEKTVKADGKTYTVTTLKKGLLKKNKTKPKKVTIRPTGITKIEKGAFNNLAKKATIKIQAGKKDFKRIKKLITKSGLPKGVKIKRIK